MHFIVTIAENTTYITGTGPSMKAMMHVFVTVSAKTLHVSMQFLAHFSKFEVSRLNHFLL